MKWRPHTWRDVAVALAILAALAGRLYFTFERGPVASDELTYVRCAENVLAGRGFVVPLFGFDLRFFLPPGYPVFLIPFLAVFGVEAVPRWVGVAQALLSLATAGLVWRTARRLAGGLAGAVAGLAYALHPYAAFYASRVLTETLALFLFGLFLFLYLDKDAGRARTAAAFGVLALASLTRPVFLVVGVVAWGALFFRRRGERWPGRLANVAVAALAFAAVVAPWVARNTALAGRPILVTNAAGKLLYEDNVRWLARGGGAYAPGVQKLPQTAEFRDYAAPVAGDPVALELAFQDFTMRKGRAIIEADKEGFLRLCGSRLAHTFSLYPKLRPKIEAKHRRLTLGFPAIAAFTALLYLTAGVGLITTRERLVKIFIPAAIVANTAVHLATIAMLRYRLPTDLMLTLAAGLGAAFIWEKGAAMWKLRKRPGDTSC